ncbi:response regulator transcription factor [Solirubrobacter phytolaccae]|uniref:Response regulator transcription factor n=1 Tax=Solirubrobacter phytolaccae TaxID=1404360 RepID=A0A9X3NC06_9ACTN|nr:response regulator transcription factor [Solirubrobacter phytolaccae]MDA0181972.1 response regulator transcription factor [Solirubrobacter phytolaccae]
MIRVLLVDDHPALRAGLESMLSVADGLEVVASAAGGREGVTLAASSRPDVVLMDLEMPDLDGAAATRAILAADDGVRVVVLTSFGDRPRILEALDAGATGYLLKDAEPEEVVRAVRAAANGDAPLDPRAAREVLSAQRETPPDLTEREREILTLVAAGHANKVIALRLGISHKTVRNTLSAACRKIGATDRTQAALWAQRSGLA